MKYCPHCGAEYLDQVDQCPDCQRALISAAEYEQIKASEMAYQKDVSEFSKVAVLENQFVADLAASALLREKIPYIIQTNEDTAYDGIFVLQKGWGALLVPNKYADYARNVVDQIMSESDAGSSSGNDDPQGEDREED